MRQNPMKLVKILWLVALLGSSSGCAYKITSSPLSIQTAPQQFNGAALHRESVKSVVTAKGMLMKNDKPTDIEMFNLLTERAIYNNIGKFSRGKVSAEQEADLIVTKVELTGDHPVPSFGADFTLGLFSFFLPPLAAIKGELIYPVSVYFEFTDKQKKAKQTGLAEFAVKGTYWGWYIGRPIAGRNLVVAQEKLVEEGVAIAVLNALYEKYPALLNPNPTQARE